MATVKKTSSIGVPASVISSNAAPISVRIIIKVVPGPGAHAPGLFYAVHGPAQRACVIIPDPYIAPRIFRPTASTVSMTWQLRMNSAARRGPTHSLLRVNSMIVSIFARGVGAIRSAVLLFGGLTAVATAQVEQITQDFKPLTGYVVSKETQGYVIDMKRADGIGVGDLLSVVGPGKPLTHPVTGKVLGQLEQTKAVLKVTQVGDEFSFARAVDGAAAVARGDPVRRYINVKALFSDQSADGSGEPLYAQLRHALPSLEWVGYATGSAATSQNIPGGLVFELRDKQLTVRDVESELVRSYRIGDVQPVTRRSLAAPAAATATGPEVMLPERTPEAPGSGVLQADFPEGGQHVDRVPGKVLVADFVRQDDRMLVVTTDGSSIQVADVTDGVNTLAKEELLNLGNITSVYWWQPAAGEPPYVVVNGWDEVETRGVIYRFAGARLTRASNPLSYIMAAFDRDEDGRPELLLGQSFHTETYFGIRVRQLAFGGKGINERKVSFPIPRNFTVQGSSFADLTGDGQPEYAQIRGNQLHIYDSQAKLLYKSAPPMGGTLSFITYEVEPDLKDSLHNTVTFELSPVAVDLDGDGQKELLAVSGERSTTLFPGVDPGVKKSWLAVFQHREGNFIRGRLRSEWEVPIQGIAADSKRMLVMVPQSHSFFTRGGGGSSLVALSLSE